MQKGKSVMHQFNYAFLDNGLLPAGLFNLTADIYSKHKVQKQAARYFQPHLLRQGQ